MRILASTPYGAYVTALDGRLTYDPLRPRVMATGVYVNRLRNSSGLTITGDWDGPADSGRVLTRWRVEAITSRRVSCENLSAPTLAVATYRLDERIQLPGSTLAVAVSEQPMTVGTIWFVESRTRPTPGVADIVARLDGLTEREYAAVFGAPRVAPFDTFWNLYTAHYALPYRLSGFLLALIYRTEGLRGRSAPA
jgi:hypothetical protein